MLALSTPVLSANLYCDRRLDEVVHLVLAPFWSEARESLPGSIGALWFMRYARRGEHIKVRLHAPEERHEALRRGLEERTLAYFSHLPASPEAAERSNNMTLPPIDDEDAGENAHADRAILWTRYRPSPIVIGSETLLPDARLVALFTGCLAAGSEIVLADLTPTAEGEYSWRMRQNLVIKLILAALAGLPFSPAQLHEYLTYHRDWLVRFMLSRSRSNSTTTHSELVAKLEVRAQQMGALVATLREVLSSQMGGGGADGDEGGNEDGGDAAGGNRHERHERDAHPGASSRLSQGMTGFFEHIVRLRSAPGPALDPYATDPVYLPLFKCLNGLSNQAGLGMPQEAQLYHLLATAAAGPAGDPSGPMSTG